MAITPYLRLKTEHRQRILLRNIGMVRYECAVVPDQFIESDGLEVVDVRSSIEHSGASGDERPVVIPDVVVDVTVDHVAAPRLRIGKHRIVAERQYPPVDLDFLESLDACEIVGRLDSAHPRVVVVADNQVFATVERLQDRLDLRRPEEEVAEDVDGIVRLHLGVPFREQHLVHLFDRPERAVAKTDDVEMPEMLV